MSSLEGSIKPRASATMRKNGESQTTQDTATAKLQRESTHNPVTGCLVWRGQQHSKEPYGYTTFPGHKNSQLAHRVAYMEHVGPIPEGHVIDHLCENTLCVNPEHLEAVQSGVNVLRGNGYAARNARKTHCPQGHEYTPENTRVAPLSLGRTGKVRFCKACARAHHLKSVARRKRHVCEGCGWYGQRVPDTKKPCPVCGSIVEISDQRESA